MLREAIFVVLGDDQIAVDDDVKYPARAFDEFGLDAELAFDCLRQTGSLGQVVSHDAVFDADLHADEPGRIDLAILVSTGRIRYTSTETLPTASIGLMNS